jgi:uncharacterized damage-inducible protein DinB
MSVVDEHGRPRPPIDGDETETLLGYLDYQRATLAWKCRGVDAAGLQVTVGGSVMTLGGMLKHMACVEHDWFVQWLSGLDKEPPWDTVDWEADEDWEFRSAADDSPEELFALWEAATARSRELTARAIAEGGLGKRGAKPWFDGPVPTLRWMLCHMIEEYARHNGHADLLRESADGQTGE